MTTADGAGAPTTPVPDDGGLPREGEREGEAVADVSRPLSRRRLLGGAGVLAAGALTGFTGCSVVRIPDDGSGPSSPPNKDPAPGRPRNIQIYNIWGDSVGSGLVTCAGLFEQSHPDIGVRVTFAPQNGETQLKLFTAIAGGDPPDVAMCGGSVAPAWTKLGIMQDLTPYFERDGIRGEDFLPVALAGMTYQDRLWHVPWDADANFPFFWNKGLFEGAGLDPEKPPTTLTQVQEYAKELTRIENGRVTQMGIIPWDTYAAANSMLTWGYAFGGELAVPGTNDVTPDNEYIVKALEWMTAIATSLGGPGALSIAPPSLATHPFVTGKLGMAGLVAPNLRQIQQLAPDIEIGSTLLPFEPPGASTTGQGAWLGGWSTFIPRSAPEPDAAWEFIKWFAISDEGTAAQWKHIGFPIAYTKAAVNAEIAADPVMGVYYEALQKMDNTRPLVTAADFYSQQLGEKVEQAVYGQISPLQALREVKALTTDEIRRFELVG